MTVSYTHLDVYKRQILNLFKEITKEGKAVIAVTHSDRVKAIADKLYYIKNGIVEGA